MSEVSLAPDVLIRARRPWLTWMLCVAVIGIFLAIQVQGKESASQWGWQPAFELWRGRQWALLTSALVHVDLWHVAFNVYWMWVLGKSVERLLGPSRCVAFILAAAFVSSAAQLAVSDQTGIGFSGVGYAMFGLAWMVSLQRPDLGVRIDRNTARAFGVWLLFGIFATQLGLMNFGNAAHVAGSVFGLCAGLAYTDRWKHSAVSAMGTLVAIAALVSVWAPWSANWNTARAMSAYSRHDYAAVIRSLDASLRRGANPVWVAQARATTHWEAGQKAEAEEDLAVLRKLDAKKAEDVSTWLKSRGK